MKGKEIVSGREIVAQEIIDLPEIVVQEEKYYLDSDMVIQYELNMLELPFFSKNGKIEKNKSIKYIFSESTDSYMQAVPLSHENAGFKIPQEFDEKIFLSIMRLAKVQGKTFVTTYYQLLKMAQLHFMGRAYKRVKESLYRLNGTTYILKNCFYSPLLKIIVPEEMSIKIIQSLRIIKLNEILKLPEETRSQYMEYFKMNNVEEVIKIVLSDEIYANIEDKGYLLYDVDKLLSIETSGERKLYQMLMKWSHKGKNKFVEKKCKFLAAKIPLSVTSENIGNTIRTLKKYSKKLVENGYLKNYEFKKASPVLESSMVYEMNPGIGRQTILEKENNKLQKDQRQPELPVIEAEKIEKQNNQLSFFGNISENDQLIKLMPEDARTKANKSLIKKYLKKVGYMYVKTNIEYTKLNAKDFSSMFWMALEKDFAEEERLKKEIKNKKEKENKEKDQKVQTKLTEAEREIKKYAMMRYGSLTVYELSAYNEKAKKHPQYSFLQSDVKSGKISKDEALKTVVVTILQKEI